MNTDKIFAESIANEYTPKDTSKVIALKKLDRKAKRPSEIFAYTFGIVFTLIAGFGMCLSMQVIGAENAANTVIGIVVGIIGLIGVGVNYPIYKKIREKGKRKYAFEITELARKISETAQG
ncbi:MAG: dihydropteridine reductase [Clostridiales bacterium]|nr:dihydropteridine reductase [Clostridiales bacterium]